jgi:hypothetical protein
MLGLSLAMTLGNPTLSAGVGVSALLLNGEPLLLNGEPLWVTYDGQ